MEVDRRGFFDWLYKGVFAFCLAGVAILSERFIQPPRKQDLSQRILVGPPGQLPPGASRYLPEHDIYVFHGPMGLFAILGKCTHLGCSVLRTPEGFSCPCHGAHFDLNGEPLSGPAPRLLTWHRVSVDAKQRVWLHRASSAKTTPPP